MLFSVKNNANRSKLLQNNQKHGQKATNYTHKKTLNNVEKP